jgi:hypothetical protein
MSSPLEQAMTIATGNFIHCRGGSFFALTHIVDDFGNIVGRATPNAMVGFCTFMLENWYGG